MNSSIRLIVPLLFLSLTLGSTAYAARTFLGQYPIAGTRSVAVNGNIAYVCSSGGIYVVDDTNPADPSLLRTVGLGFNYGHGRKQLPE